MRISVNDNLCASAYIHDKFRNEIMDRMSKHNQKASAPEYGIDIQDLLENCKIANRIELIKNICLSILFSILICNLSADFFKNLVSKNSLSVILDFFVRYRYIFLLAVIVVFIEKQFIYFKITKMVNKVKNTNSGEYLINNEENGNVVIYSGYSPFVGAGYTVGGWSFALDMKKIKKEYENVKELLPVKFTVEEMYNYITQTVNELKIYNLNSNYKVFVDGKNIQDNEFFLKTPYDKPCNKIDSSLLNEFVNTSNQNIRVYQHIQIFDWNEELILSIFLRFKLLNDNLFIETNYNLLSPIKNEYRVLDNYRKTTLKKIVFSIIPTSISVFFLLPISFIDVFSRINNNFYFYLKERREHAQIKNNLIHDYGVQFSIRELVSTNNYRKYFQKLDKEMYIKILERQILDSIIQFLDERNIDTSDLKERQNTILNSGTIINCENISGDNVVIGKKIKSFISKINEKKE